MTTPLEKILQITHNTQTGPNQWDAKCPCRDDDDHPSLRISQGRQGQVLLKCQRGGGCDINQICDSLKIKMTDLFPPTTKPNLTLTDTYRYTNENNETVFEVLRYTDENGKKTFKQRRPGPNGTWDWTTSDIQKPLYRLPQILKAKQNNETIYIVEGEKDVHTLEKLGKTATTNAGGASSDTNTKWQPHHTQTLAGCNIIIIADNDEPGHNHARNVAKQLRTANCNVKTYTPTTHKDITEIVQHTQNTNQKITDHLTPLETPLTQLIDTLQTTNPTDTQKINQALQTYKNTTNPTPPTQNPIKTTLWTTLLDTPINTTYDWIIPNLLEKQDRVIIVAAEGAGKRAATTSLIPTPDGYTKLGDIKVGDNVFDRFGNIVQVTYVSPIEPNPDAYRVHFSDNSHVDCDAEHNWYTETINEREKRQLGKVRTTQQIKQTLISNRTTKALNHAIPTTQPLQLPDIDLPIDPYTLGAWLGDGNSGNGGITNHPKDHQIIERIANHYTTRVRPSSLKNSRTPTWGILGLQTQLRKNNLLNNKHIPPKYLRASYNQRLALLQGLMDTDGTIDKNGKVEFSVTNHTLAKNFHELLMTMGIKATLKTTNATLNKKTIGTRHRIHFKTSQPIFHLTRKAQRITQQKTNRTKYRYITKIEKINPTPMLCISVNGPDNTYLIGENHIPTHNTTLSKQIALMTAAGIHPFRHTPIKPAVTLTIDLENPERIIHRTTQNLYKSIQKHTNTKNINAHLLLKPDGLNLLNPHDQQQLEQHIQNIQPDLILLGPLYKAYTDPGTKTAEATTTEIAKYLDHIRTTYNCALWLEHHAPLGTQGHRELRPFGSAVWSRWSEYGIALTPDPTDPNTIQLKHYRGQREPRDWPETCTRGTTWPFEPITYTQYTP